MVVASTNIDGRISINLFAAALRGCLFVPYFDREGMGGVYVNESLLERMFP